MFLYSMTYVKSKGIIQLIEDFDVSHLIQNPVLLQKHHRYPKNPPQDNTVEATGTSMILEEF